MAAFQIGLYALGLLNCVSANWLSRTYSSHVSWITGQAMDIGAPAILFLIDAWEGHLTPPEAASIADKQASSGRDVQTVRAAAELALSVLPHAHALNYNEIQRAVLQCKEQSDAMLERACLTVEAAAKGGGVYPEVLYTVARYWHELYLRQANEESEPLLEEPQYRAPPPVAVPVPYPIPYPFTYHPYPPPIYQLQYGGTTAPHPGAQYALPPYFVRGLVAPAPPPAGHPPHAGHAPPAAHAAHAALPALPQHGQHPAHPPPHAPHPQHTAHPQHAPLAAHPQHQALAQLPPHQLTQHAPLQQHLSHIQHPAPIAVNVSVHSAHPAPIPPSLPASHSSVSGVGNLGGGNGSVSGGASASVNTGASTIPQAQLRRLLAAYRVGMLALESQARRVHDDRPQNKFARNPPYGEHVKWLLRISKRLGAQYLHQFCVCAVNSVVSPFVLYELCVESAHWLARGGPHHLVMQHLRGTLAPLMQKCQQMYIQCIHQKLYHLTSVEYEEFVSIVLSARTAFQLTPEGNTQFKEWLASLRRSKSCKKELWTQLNAALQTNGK